MNVQGLDGYVVAGRFVLMCSLGIFVPLLGVPVVALAHPAAPIDLKGPAEGSKWQCTPSSMPCR
jgi:hypothetical protein